MWFRKGTLERVNDASTFDKTHLRTSVSKTAPFETSQ